ncbi:MAG: nucleotidyltransferase family protein, partial [Rhizobiaceae bacterium]
VVLAAGRSSRMGGPNKLLSRFDGVTLVRRSVERATASSADAVVVVTGHQHDEIGRALAGTSARIVHNERFGEGLSSSLKAGVKAAGEAAGILVMLADMPGITTGDLDRIIQAARDNPGAVIRATHGGRRGNPVVLPEPLLDAVNGLAGDAGARALVESAGDDAIDVEIGAGALLDVDTPEALDAAGGVAEG